MLPVAWDGLTKTWPSAAFNPHAFAKTSLTLESVCASQVSPGREDSAHILCKPASNSRDYSSCRGVVSFDTSTLFLFYFFGPPAPLVIITKLEYLILKSSIPRQYISNNTAVKSDK